MTWSPYEDRSLDASWSETSLVENSERPLRVDDWRPGAPLPSALASALAGAVGGTAFLFAAGLVARETHVALNVLSLAGAAAHRIGIGGSTENAAFLLAASAGALLGAFSGLLTRRLTRFSGRLLFFAIFAPVIWVFAQAFVLRRLAPWTADGLPFLPFVAGAGAFALCLAIVPPIPGRRRKLRPTELSVSRV